MPDSEPIVDLENLEPEVTHYNSLRRQFEQAEAELFAKINLFMESEVSVLALKLEEKLGWWDLESMEIPDYEVHRPDQYHDKPYVVLGTPYNLPSQRKGHEHADIHEIPLILEGLNNILAPEYQRIQEQYGFEVAGFDIEIDADHT